MKRRREGAEPPKAYDRALGLLARREHSARELERKLRAKGHEAGEGAAAVAALRRADYQSDARFAEALARQRMGAGYGPRHIQAEVSSHGIASALVRPLLDAQDWPARAVALARRKLGSRPDTREARLKVAQWLPRRGFPAEAIRAATAMAMDPADPEAD